MLESVQAIVLAAGKSKRFKTGSSKLTHLLCGQPIILYQTLLIQSMGMHLTIVVGRYKDDIYKAVSSAHQDKIDFVEQPEQHGTGHATAVTKALWHKKYILVCNGDVPLITTDIINELYQKHIETNAAITFVIAHDNNPTNQYGRVVRTGDKITIIEAKDLTKISDEYCCVNAGIYLFNKTFLDECIDMIPVHGTTQEYYLTALIDIANTKGLIVSTVSVPFDRVRGINTLEELWVAEQIKRSELIKHHMNHGVRFLMPQTTHIDITVTLDAGCIIGSGVQLTGTTHIGKNSIIEHFSVIHDATIEQHVTIKANSIIEKSHVEKDAVVGPFAYVRNGSLIQHNAMIGSFVEIKKTIIGAYSKAKHLTYLGDTTVGEHVNIGGGTITANHDSVHKHKTVIKEHAYVGAHNTLVAPIEISAHAYTAAGSTITEDVPVGTLAIARARQTNKTGYVELLKEKLLSSTIKKKKHETDEASYHAAVKTDEKNTPIGELRELDEKIG